MIPKVPTIQAVRGYLESLTYAQLEELAKSCNIPFTTLWKIKDGSVSNPGIGTVGKFYPAAIAARLKLARYVARKKVKDCLAGVEKLG